MIKNCLRKLIKELLKEEITDTSKINDEAVFNGYNPIEKIRNGLFHWVAVPFNGKFIYCQLRCPNATQIEQCGNITNIVEEKLQPDNIKKLNYEELIQIRNYQEALCKITFNIPTFDKILSVVGDNDFVISEKRKELEEIEKTFNENKNTMSEIEKATIDSRIKTIELQIGFILPDDTMAFITKWAMGNDISDIKKINKNMFLRAAVLAQINHKAPSDYISGTFTDYNKSEIDAYALSIYQDFQKDQKTVQESKHKWFLGGRKRTEDEEILPKRKK